MKYYRDVQYQLQSVYRMRNYKQSQGKFLSKLFHFRMNACDPIEQILVIMQFDFLIVLGYYHNVILVGLPVHR